MQNNLVAALACTCNIYIESSRAKYLANFGVEFLLTSADYGVVKVTAAKTTKTKSDGELLDQATSSLLKAVKQRMLKKNPRVDYAKMRKDGYSDRFLAKLEGA